MSAREIAAELHIGESTVRQDRAATRAWEGQPEPSPPSPPSLRDVVLVAAAFGHLGESQRVELRKRADLPRDALERVLTYLADAGLVVVREEKGHNSAAPLRFFDLEAQSCAGLARRHANDRRYEAAVSDDLEIERQHAAV